MLYRYFMFSGVGLNYQRIGWLDVDAERDATDQVIKWMAGSEWNVRNGVGLILHGSMGTGKTMLSNLVLKAMLAEGYEGYQTTLANMIDLHTAGWNGKNEEKSWYYRRVKNVDVLVIDDVGREVRQQRMVDTADGRVMKSHASPVVQVALEDVLRHRTTISRPTILTMNLSLREFREKYGEHSIGLMDESAVAIEFRGVTWRPKKREREEQERAMRLSRPVVVG
jgi:DNA replication protein DnaC